MDSLIHNGKLYQSTREHQFYYTDTDSGNRIDILEFYPATTPTFYMAVRADNQQPIQLHYTRIFVERKDDKSRTASETDNGTTLA